MVWGKIIRAVRSTADHGGPRAGASAKECTRKRDERGGKGPTPMAKGSGGAAGSAPALAGTGEVPMPIGTTLQVLVWGKRCNATDQRRAAARPLHPLVGPFMFFVRCGAWPGMPPHLLGRGSGTAATLLVSVWGEHDRSDAGAEMMRGCLGTA